MPTGRRRGSAWLAVLLVGLTACGQGTAAPVAPPPAPATRTERWIDLAVGDCITNRSYVAADIDPTTVGCETSSGVFELVTKTTEDENCPDGLRETSGYAVLINSKTTLCFVLNLNEGECYMIEASKRSFEPSACTSGAGIVRVEKRVDGSSDESVCAPGQTSVSFPEPARVYCFSAA